MGNLINPNAADQLAEAKRKAEELQREARTHALLRSTRQSSQFRVSAYVFVSTPRSAPLTSFGERDVSAKLRLHPP